MPIQDSRVSLVKAGTVQATNKARAGVAWPDSDADVAYGGSTDLWGGTWAPSDVNNANFGVALSVTETDPTSDGQAFVDVIEVTIYYTLASGFTVAQDAVVYANEIAELRTEGMQRTPDGSVYGPIGQVIGDLPRLPPSALEVRPVELFLKITRGNFDDEPDSALDIFTAQVKYRPCYLSRP